MTDTADTWTKKTGLWSEINQLNGMWKACLLNKRLPLSRV